MYHLGFVSEKESEIKPKSHVTQILKTSTRESVDLALSALRGTRVSRGSLSYNDLGTLIKSSPYLAEVLVSLNIKDSEGTKAALQNLKNLNDESYRTNITYASTLPGATDEKI